MLYISIIISVWFVLWIWTANDIRTCMECFAEMEEDSEQEAAVEQKDAPIQGQLYHLSCPACNHTFWSSDSNLKYCPYCGQEQGLAGDEDGEEHTAE